MAKIFHADLYGDRNTKYDYLMKSDISKTKWFELLLQTPFYLLVPQDTEFLAEYEQGWRITDVMPVNSTGVKTHRDHFVLDFEKTELCKRIEQFRNLDIDDDEIVKMHDISSRSDWDLNQKRHSLAAKKDWKSSLTKCLYRPFDIREYYHHEDVVDRPRNEIMQHMMANENLGLITTRQVTNLNFCHVLCTTSIIEMKTCSHDRGTNLFPLYLYSESNFSRKAALQKQQCSNISRKFLQAITANLGYTPTPEAIFHYIYAIFHSPTYRSRYAEFLKIDFPRVPLTRNDALFRQLETYGEELVTLHLMKSPKLDNFITQFVDKGGKQIVDPGHPKYANGKVTINKKGDCFTGVPEEVWNFYVGGYPVCAKWLKDRKGRTLSAEDIAHYQRIVVALQETIHLMQQIDTAIPGFPIE